MGVCVQGHWRWITTWQTVGAWCFSLGEKGAKTLYRCSCFNKFALPKQGRAQYTSLCFGVLFYWEMTGSISSSIWSGNWATLLYWPIPLSLLLVPLSGRLSWCTVLSFDVMIFNMYQWLGFNKLSPLWWIRRFSHLDRLAFCLPFGERVLEDRW